jgi:hypothetical protein
MVDQNLTNKWLHYPWLPDQNLDHLIHPADLYKLNGQGLGLVLCLEDAAGGYIKVSNNLFKGSVLRSGVKSIFPAPAYFWDQEVKIKTKPQLVCFIHNFFWHHKDEKYYYQLVIGQKIDKKRYQEAELELKK